jgi:hypothetical protein
LFSSWTEETYGRRDGACAQFAFTGAEATSVKMFAVCAIFRDATVSPV